MFYLVSLKRSSRPNMFCSSGPCPGPAAPTPESKIEVIHLGVGPAYRPQDPSEYFEPVAQDHPSSHGLQPKRAGQKSERRADPFPSAVTLPREFEIAVGAKVIAVFGVDRARLLDDRSDHPGGSRLQPR